MALKYGPPTPIFGLCYFCVAPQQSREECMAKKTKSEGVYRIVDVVGVNRLDRGAIGLRKDDAAEGTCGSSKCLSENILNPVSRL